MCSQSSVYLNTNQRPTRPKVFIVSMRIYKQILPQCGSRVLIDPSAVVIGDVHLADDCSVWPQAVIRGDMHSIRIGARSSVQDGSVLHITHAGPFNPDGYPLTIGEDVTIGHQALLHGCSIGSRVLIGMGSIVMDGARIDDLYMGRPAQQVRALTEQEMAYFTYTAANYVRLKDEYLLQQD